MNAIAQEAVNRALLEAKMARWQREMVGERVRNLRSGKTRTVTDLVIRKGRLVAVLDGKCRTDFERLGKMWEPVDE